MTINTEYDIGDEIMIAGGVKYLVIGIRKYIGCSVEYCLITPTGPGYEECWYNAPTIRALTGAFGYQGE